MYVQTTYPYNVRRPSYIIGREDWKRFRLDGRIKLDVKEEEWKGLRHGTDDCVWSPSETKLYTVQTHTKEGGLRTAKECVLTCVRRQKCIRVDFHSTKEMRCQPFPLICCLFYLFCFPEHLLTFSCKETIPSMVCTRDRRFVSDTKWLLLDCPHRWGDKVRH